MKTRDTSETHKRIGIINNGSNVVDAEWVWQLEQERDEARQRITNLEYSNEAHRLTAETWREAAIERDQLRKVADELMSLLGANHTSSCSIQDSEEPRCDCGYQQHYEMACEDYNSLPHVIAAKKGNEE